VPTGVSFLAGVTVAAIRYVFLILSSVLLGGTGCYAAASALPAHAVVRDWPALPPGHVLGECTAVGVDSRSNVVVLHRSGRGWSTPFPTETIAAPTVSVLDGCTGKLLAAWGTNQFIMPHGLTVDAADHVWITDVGRQQVFKFSPDGQRLLLTLGERGVHGADQGHFNLPSDVAVLPDGSCYVSDGYKNTRVVKFSAAGRYEFEWGGKGAGPGQFNLPHGVAVDGKGRVIVCDRSNSRLQVFDPKGAFLAEWKGPLIGRPYGVSVGADGNVFLIDGGDGPLKRSDRPRVVELDAEGRVVDRFGAFGTEPGQFLLGHDIAVARDGSVYIADAGGKRVLKFVRTAAKP
jgi:peptidylamidoglycolate lyase